MKTVKSSKKRKEHGTTKHITIICLKYLFLYIKSGRKAFNNQDLASFILKEIYIPSDDIKLSSDREKSIINFRSTIGIERRLYDIISVFCGLGLVKRKTDAIEWNLTSKDYEAGIHSKT